MIPEQWTSSLTADSRKFKEVWDGIGRSSHNPIYTCMVRMVQKSWYITWEGVQRKGIKKPREKKIKKYDTKRRTLDSWLYYSGYAENDFCILYSQLFFQTTHDCYLIFKIMLVFSPTLYKFIVWACWARTQSCFRVQAKTGPHNWRRLWGELDLIWRKLWSNVGDGRIRFTPTNDWPTPR